jgi:hypothetical protein
MLLVEYFYDILERLNLQQMFAEIPGDNPIVRWLVLMCITVFDVECGTQ